MNTKKDFIGLANAEFTGDYGLCLKWILTQANEYQYMKALFFDKMQNLENKIDEMNNSLQNKQNEEKVTTNQKRLG